MPPAVAAVMAHLGGGLLADTHRWRSGPHYPRRRSSRAVAGCARAAAPSAKAAGSDGLEIHRHFHSLLSVVSVCRPDDLKIGVHIRSRVDACHTLADCPGNRKPVLRMNDKNYVKKPQIAVSYYENGPGSGRFQRRTSPPLWVDGPHCTVYGWCSRKPSGHGVTSFSTWDGCRSRRSKLSCRATMSWPMRDPGTGSRTI